MNKQQSQKLAKVKEVSSTVIKLSVYWPFPIFTLTGLTHKTKETGFLAGDSADEIKISRS
ncbi:MAG TPA: hypothetical protein V6D21_08825 [Candidatus Obscuribacterales bacterium]